METGHSKSTTATALVSFGLSHRTAPVGARERAAASLGDVRAWLGGLHNRRAIVEAFVLSTCHRLEFFLLTSDEREARRVVAEACDLPVGTLDRDGTDGWAARDGEEAAVHLARVAAGLDSLIVGEAEIAGQVRRAAAVAREAGSLGQRLEIILAGALRSSGRVRAETRLGHGVTSAASAGVALAVQTLGTLADRHVLVVGAGQAARTALTRLSRGPVGCVSVASRSRRHAEEAAAIAGADVWNLADIPARLADVDVVVAAVHTDMFVITADLWDRASRADGPRRRILVDLSIPRAIDPAVAKTPGTSLFSVDDLGELAGQSARRRAREVPAAEAIVRDEARRAWARFVRLAERPRGSRAVGA